MTKEEKLSLGLHILTMLEAYISQALWNLVYLEFKQSYDDYLATLNKRKSCSLIRQSAVKKLSETTQNLNNVLSSVARLLKNEVGQKEIKYKEFFSTGKASDVTKGNPTDQLLAIDYLLEALENNSSLHSYSEYYQTVKDLKTELEKDFKKESASQKNEDESVTLLNLEENKYDFALKKIKHFVEDHVDAKEAARILKNN